MERGTVYSAVDGPRGDHLQCHGWSGGTTYSMTVPSVLWWHGSHSAEVNYENINLGYSQDQGYS